MSPAARIRACLCGFLMAAVFGLFAAEDSGRTEDEFEVELSDPVSPELPPRAYRVASLVDQDGFPAGYRLSFTTHVCLDNQCRTVQLTMFWDALGFYQRLEYPVDAPLTKKEHVPFQASDYAKLDQILKERDSVLATCSLNVVVAPPTLDEQAALAAGLDGWSGATPQAVKDAVVDDAAYTSWTLWHWANGQIVSKLQNQTRQRATPAYLQRLLRSRDRRAVDFALRHILAHCPTDGRFVDDVFHVLETSDREHILLALKFLDDAVPDARERYARLIDSFCRLNGTNAPLVLEYFAAQADLPPETRDGLAGVLDRLPYFQVHLILRLFEAKGFFSETIEAHVVALLEHREFFIARRASEYLAKQTLDAESHRSLEAFRQRHRGRL